MRVRQVLISAVLAASCNGVTDPSHVRIYAISDTELTGTVATKVTPAPTVRAADQLGRPLSGVVIVFEARGGVIAQASATTGKDGLASVGTWTLGTAAGLQTVEARAAGGGRVLFNARAISGPIAQLAHVSGNDQFAAVSQTLIKPLLVRVTDAFGNPVRNAPVTFSVISGGGSIAGDNAATDTSGVAASGRWVLGPVPGTQQVRAQSATANVVFAAYACDTCPTFLFVRDRSIYRSIGRGAEEEFVTAGYSPAWSPDGERVAFVRPGANRVPDIYVMDADGSNVVRTTFGNLGPSAPGFFAGFHSPTWSHDGRMIAVATGGVYYGEIHVLNVDDGSRRGPITDMAEAPAWSPDGRSIAFVSLSGDDGYHALHVMNADGSNIRVVVPRDPGFIDHPVWSPDGRRIAFAKCIDTCNIYSVSADGSDLKQLTHVPLAFSPVWSPDGRWIAFTLGYAFSADPEARPSIALVPTDTGGEPSVIIASGYQPAWRPGFRCCSARRVR